MGILSKFSNWFNGDDDEDLDEEYENYVYEESGEDADDDDDEEEKPSLFARLKARFIRSDDELDDEEDDEDEDDVPAYEQRSNLASQNTRLTASRNSNLRQVVSQREHAYTNTVNRQASAAGTFAQRQSYAAQNASYPQKTPLVASPERTASLNAAANSPQKQFSVMKPTSFEDSSSIVDVLRNGKAIIVNFEGFSPAISQRIMDFICGCIYTIDGQILQISGYIFIVAPKDVDITGDYTAFLQQDSFGVPTFRQ
ncbi:MAG: cell division protein SepF [Lachnospiraceae bacterium]|nr:cell division protein SepF [Lachnospiraceae bacterium]